MTKSFIDGDIQLIYNHHPIRSNVARTGEALYKLVHYFMSIEFFSASVYWVIGMVAKF